jgi:peroxiredoxin Q/BCP
LTLKDKLGIIAAAFEHHPIREEVERMSDTLQVGSPAPAGDGMTIDEKVQSLGAFRGQWSVLFFYPRAHTSGCTREAQAFNALLDSFEALDAQVIGVSTDKAGTLAKFRDKHDFRFLLLSDADKEISTAYGTLKEHGKSSNRVTYLIDPEGTVRAVWPMVKVDGHAEAVLARLEELQGEGAGQPALG